MRKMFFKRILSILDAIEIYDVSLHDAPVKVYEEVVSENGSIKLKELKELINYLCDKKVLKETPQGFDLCPAAAIYAKANQNSSVEAFAIFESMLHDPMVFKFYLMQMNDNEYRSKQEVLNFIDMQSLQFMLQTNLFEVEQEKIRFHPKLIKGITQIIQEYKDATPPLISIALTAFYTSNVVAHEDLRVVYKNTNYTMIPYRYKKTITNIIPRKGIPHDRDETKALQAFYKRTLFHEFDHECPICEINFPHMLIASHIKPFRDCAHIYEAIDHNNGLLLCRNHDYLFDQGYISFDEHGHILICKELLNHKNMEDSFRIFKDYQLPKEFLTENRLLFLKCHREYIFKK